MPSTHPPSANSTTSSLQPPQYSSLGFDGSQPSNPNGLSNIPTGIYLDEFNPQMPQLINPPSSLNSLELFGEPGRIWQPQGHVIAPAEQNSQPRPDIQLGSSTPSGFIGGHFNDLSATVPSDFWDLHSGSDLIAENPNHGANSASQMATPTIQRPYLLQSQTWLPAPTVSLDLPLYELSNSAASGSGNIVCSETNTINNLVNDVSNTASSWSFPEARSTVSTAPLARVPSWVPTAATEPIDILHPDQYVLGPQNESNGPLFSGNNTLEATFEQQRRESDRNDCEAIGASGIDVYQPDKLNQLLTGPTQIKAAARVFGPSRPVSLPPARRGGRKGVLSKEELEKRRESRRAGVCIKCRQMKLKVSSSHDQREIRV
jgi:hypothetical protein